MSPNRRSFLLGSSMVMTALAGCQTLAFGERTQIDLQLANYTDREQRLKLSLLPEDGDGSDKPTVDSKEYTVPAPESPSDAAGGIRKNDIAPERRYLVRVELRNGRFETFHTHYHPNGSTDEEIFIRIYRDETTENLFVDFRGV